VRIDIHHYHHSGDHTEEALARRISRIAQRLHKSNNALCRAIDNAAQSIGAERPRHTHQEIPMSTSDLDQAFANLEAEATRNDELDSSASQLFTRLADEIEKAKGDPTRVQAIADRLRSSNDALAAAIVANTPSDPSNQGEGGQG
jgi:hypothetical protein